MPPTRRPGAPRPRDLVVVAYLQLPAAERRAANRNALESLRPGGTFLLVAHDSTNLAEGTGGPQDPAVLMTAADVLADLDGRGRGAAGRAGRAEVAAGRRPPGEAVRDRVGLPGAPRPRLS